MQNLQQRIEAFSNLGSFIGHELSSNTSSWLQTMLLASKQQNGWFDAREVKFALGQWSQTMTEKSLTEWVSKEQLRDITSNMNIGLILAGNIPMVGFHDILSTIISGKKAQIKLSSSDSVIIPALLQKLVDIDPNMSKHFTIADKLGNFEAVIATGSNNSARYFERYFDHVPHIIRKNRTSVAIINGSESEDEMRGLMHDCFQYFGLGCRNVTKLFLPAEFDLNKIFSASLPFTYLMDNKKYVNNYTYHKALMLMEKKPVLENELIMMVENPSLFSPICVLNYEYYRSDLNLKEMLEPNFDHLQCVVGHNQLPFGSAQTPRLDDYADGINTLNFLQNLQAEQLSN